MKVISNLTIKCMDTFKVLLEADLASDVYLENKNSILIVKLYPDKETSKVFMFPMNKVSVSYDFIEN